MMLKVTIGQRSSHEVVQHHQLYHVPNGAQSFPLD